MAETVKTVRMAKDGQPDSDVHPNEVENWKEQGWFVKLAGIKEAVEHFSEPMVATPKAPKPKVPKTKKK